jgi:phosphoenolpyruvate synthase/pyruvate phosphate dikinase
MVRHYRALERLATGSSERAEATEAFRQDLERWIQTADAGEAFRTRLRAALEETFGPDGSYGVFVRSDTNVEDLPGFTGAGLNLTVPNVVGSDSIIAAVSRVWASPFSARAFAWRQSHMRRPEHVYPAVLLLQSVSADKSGVLVSIDVDNGDPSWLSVAVNEGVGGAVDGQAAESLRINTVTGDVRLMAQATARIRRTVEPTGGVAKKPVSGDDRVLQPNDVSTLITLVEELPQRFPGVVDAQGQLTPVDIEFGFRDGKLMLFQIRPFVESTRARSNDYLRALDSGLKDLREVQIDLNARPSA